MDEPTPGWARELSAEMRALLAKMERRDEEWRRRDEEWRRDQKARDEAWRLDCRRREAAYERKMDHYVAQAEADRRTIDANMIKIGRTLVVMEGLLEQILHELRIGRNGRGRKPSDN